MEELFVAGALAGLTVAVPIGPLGLLCMERSLRSGFGAGFSTGLGGVAANLLYAGLLLLGLHHLLPALEEGGPVLAAGGGLFLLWSAVQVARRPAPAAGGGGRGMPCVPAFLSAFALNVCNPLSVVLVLAALSPAADAPLPGPRGAAVLLAGMGVAASAWWACLSLGTSTLRTRLRPPVLLAANRLAAVLLAAYGALALLRAANG